MSEFERLEQLLAEAEIASTQAAHRIRVERCRKEFASIRVDAHAIAHEICNARESYQTILAECATEGKRLGAWAAEIRVKNADMEARKTHLLLSDPTVKEIWDRAVAILRHEANAYAKASEAREVHKTYGEKMLDKATIDMRMGRADIIERIQDLRSWLHSEEEQRRRNEIKWNLRQEYEDKARKFQEGIELDRFCVDLQRLLDEIGEKLDAILPSLIAESQEAERKAAFVAKMREAKAAKKNNAAVKAAAVEAQRLAEEAELQRLIEEEAAAKLAEENKAKAAFFLAQIEQAEDLDDVKAYAMAANEFDTTVNTALIVNEAAARFQRETVQESREAAKRVEVCHVKPTKLHAKERRELARQGVRGRDWSNVIEEM